MYRLPLTSFQRAINLSLSIMLFTVLTGCEAPDFRPQGERSNSDETLNTFEAADAERNVPNFYPSLSWQTSWELQQARAATARYRNIENAKRDGYADINVIAENMGYHFMKEELLDAHFDLRKPEILVYNKLEDGLFELVAVEYAIPLNLSAQAPAGFTGDDDEWNENHVFGLWLLHAWVWSYNPDGVFNPTNPLVHLHP